MNEEFDYDQKPGSTMIRELFDWIESGVTAVACVILIFTFVGRLVGVEGESMLPTLHSQDRLVAANLFYTPENGDIVVVTKPNDRNEPLIKRVIATGGQKLDIDFRNNLVFVNDKKIEEPYIGSERMHPDSWCDIELPVTVPEGHVFVMGDNRNNSWDSRVGEVGFVDERHILGKIIYRVMPYNNMGVPDEVYK